MVDDISRPVHVLAALERFRRQIDADLRRLASDEMRHLRGSHGRILDLLGNEGTRPSALAADAWITKQAISQRIRELEEAGLVETTPDPTDGRAVVVKRTAEGDQVRASAVATIRAAETEWANLVGPDRYATFRQVIDELGLG